MTISELHDAWDVNNRINLKLLKLCSDEDFDLKPGKGKTIRSNYVHIVGVRRMWMAERMKKESQAIPKLDWKTATRSEIEEGLAISCDLMKLAFDRQEETGRPQRWTTLTWFAYCVAHEAHHRSQIEIALRINGREPDEMKLMSLWDWPKS